MVERVLVLDIGGANNFIYCFENGFVYVREDAVSFLRCTSAPGCELKVVYFFDVEDNEELWRAFNVLQSGGPQNEYSEAFEKLWEFSKERIYGGW